MGEQDCSLLVMSRNASDIRALLRAGADPCAVDEDGNDAFWHALHIDHDFEDGFDDNPQSIIALGCASPERGALSARQLGGRRLRHDAPHARSVRR